MNKLTTRDMVFLGLVALAIRMLYLAEHAQSPFYAVPLLDQKYYDLFARTIVAGGDWSVFGGFRPVLYPLFLAAVYATGAAAFGIARALLLQHVIGVGTTLLVAAGAASLFNSRRAGLWAGALYTLAGPPLFYEGELLVESVLPFLIAAVLLVHLAATRRNTIGGWIAGGALLAVACQARPNLLAFWIVYPALALLRVAVTRKPAAGLPMAGLVAALAVQALFGVLNMKQSGEFHLVTGAGGINFYLGNNRQADGMIPRQAWSVTYEGEYRDSIDEYARQAYERAMRAEGREPVSDTQAVSDYWTQRAKDEIKADPGAWLRLMLKKKWLLLWNYEAPNNTSYLFVRDHESRILRFLPVTWALLLALLPAGVLLAWRQPQREGLVVVLLYLAAYAATIVLFFVNGRFRIPLWPAMAMLGGGAAACLVELVRTRAWKPLGLYAAAIALIMLLSSLNLAGAKKPDYARDFMFRSYAWYAMGRQDEARADIEQSLRMDPSDINALFHSANVAYSQNRLEEARALYTNVLARSATEPRVWNNLGATCDLLGDFPAAHAAYLKSLDLRPGHPDALLNLALLEFRAGRNAEAAARLQAVTGAEENVMYLCLRSWQARVDGDAEKASALAAKAAQRDATSTEGLLKLLEEGAKKPIEL